MWGNPPTWGFARWWACLQSEASAASQDWQRWSAGLPVSRKRWLYVPNHDDDYMYTLNISVNVQNTLCKATVTLSGLHTARMQWVFSEAENSTIVTIVNFIIQLELQFWLSKLVNTLANLQQKKDWTKIVSESLQTSSDFQWHKKKSKFRFQTWEYL